MFVPVMFVPFLVVPVRLNAERADVLDRGFIFDNLHLFLEDHLISTSIQVSKQKLFARV